jgi:uncharacterized protein YbjT (DUF2867 family)
MGPPGVADAYGVVRRIPRRRGSFSGRRGADRWDDRHLVKRVLVTGATGNIGREVVAQLSAAGGDVRAMSRRPDIAGLPHGVTAVRGDLSQPDTLDACLDGVEAVFLVWQLPLAPFAPALQRIASRAQSVVLLTSPHRTPHPFYQQPNALRRVHAGIEQLIEQSALRWTFLRPSPFAINSVFWWAPQIRSGNVVRWNYATAATAPIHEHDVAAVAVRALRDEGHAATEYVLTGPESLTQREQVEMIGDVIGRPLQYEELSPAAARQYMGTRMPPAITDMLLTAYAAATDRPALVTSTVADVTGDPARSFRQWAADHAAAFVTPG